MASAAALVASWAVSAGPVQGLPAAELASAEADATDANNPKPPRYDWPAFANWDCIANKQLVDWDAVYSEVVSGLKGEGGVEPTFLLPDYMVALLQERAWELRSECPMGTLYFLVLYTYEVVSERGGQAAVAQANALVQELRTYPFFVIAGARWPTYEALNHFSHLHRPQNPKAMKNTLCEGVRGSSGIDWDALLVASKIWSDEQLKGLEPGQGNYENAKVLKAGADAVYQDPKNAGVAAQQECPFGFLFLCTTQVLAAAMRLTGSFEPWARAVDKMLAELPYFSVAGSKWPTFRMLAMMSSLSKGEEVKTLGAFQGDVHRWGGNHPQTKRFRQYGDLRLTESELCPLGRDENGWRNVDILVDASAEVWYGTMLPRSLGDVRPIFGEALRAVLHTVRAQTSSTRGSECGFSGITAVACEQRGCHWTESDAPSDSMPSCRRLAPARKITAVTFVWGERWAPLVPRFVAWAAMLQLHTIVVAMGDACRRACEAAVAAIAGSAGVACWDPLRESSGSSSGNAERGSILQRHAMMHLLLHLGIDVVAFDFDTFFFSDPRLRLEALAKEHGADVLMTRHLDADCLNMGLIYIQASARTAKWYSRYLEWLHQHPFEREQRGANALLGFTKQRVSFPPQDLPSVRAVALDDLNEFASSRGGWLGDWSKLIFFHWINPVRTPANWGDIKVADLWEIYKAALHSTTNIVAGGGSLARMIGTAEEQSVLGPIRPLMESMTTAEAPVREECW